MTTNLTDLVPLKWKTWIGLIGSVVTFAVPLVLSVQDYLPAPWPAVIGAALSVLTALGIYKAPYVPQEAVIAPDTPAVQAAAQQAPPSEVAPHRNPWE